MPDIDSMSRYAPLGLADKGRAIKGFVVCNNWDLEPLDLLKGLALGCYQPSSEVLIVSNPTSLQDICIISSNTLEN